MNNKMALGAVIWLSLLFICYLAHLSGILGPVLIGMGILVVIGGFGYLIKSL